MNALLLLATLTAADRPNVVVILADDMGWSDIACYGGEVPTPNLDRLAAGGMRFTQFLNTGRCSPTRASLLTGQYPHAVGMGHLDNKVVPGHPGFQGRLSGDCVTLAEVLGGAGYFTAMTGKWHLGQDHGCTPWGRGFDRSLNFARGGVYHPDQTPSRAGVPIYLDGTELPTDDPRFGADWHTPHLITDWGLKFVDEAAAADRPFFLYLAHCSPHFPLMAPQETIAKYRGRYLQGWDELRKARHARQIGMNLVDADWPLSPLPPRVPAWDDVPDDKRDRFDHIMSIYAAMIETMDESVGTLVAGLEERGELENTLILFLSDNGGNAESGPDGIYKGDNPGDRHSNVFLGQNWATLANTPFRKYKHHVHEGGIATPLIAHWPAGIAAGRPLDWLQQGTHLIDVMPTLVDVCGAEYPTRRGDRDVQPMAGVSLRPMFAGEKVQRKQPLFFNHEDNKAVRDGRWKLVRLKGRPWELYDLESDRTELDDLAAEEPERVAVMQRQYRQWAKAGRVEVPGIDPWQRRDAR